MSITDAPGSDELYPPAQYGWGWLLLAIGILAVLILAAWLVIALTRPRQSMELRDVAGPVQPADVLRALRTDYLTRIDRIEQQYSEGGMDARKANLELSRTVRAFVNEYSGLEAPVLALNDLVARGVRPELIEALRRHYYPGIFLSAPSIDTQEGIAAARKVVTTWH